MLCGLQLDLVKITAPSMQLPATLSLFTLCHCSVLSEVVDELIQEAWAEVGGQQSQADAFAFDLLVASVAFSQGKYDVGTQVGRTLQYTAWTQLPREWEPQRFLQTCSLLLAVARDHRAIYCYMWHIHTHTYVCV